MKNPLFLILIGALLGALFMAYYTRLTRVEHIIANHNVRLLVLEQERTERVQFRARVKKIWAVCAGFGRKLLGQ